MAKLKTKSKPRKKTGKPRAATTVTLADILRVISDRGLQLRNDIQRVIGTVVSDNPEEDSSRKYHRLKSITGRIPFSKQVTTQYIASLEALRGFVEARG